MQRPLIPVAAGCLVNERGEVLIAQRPQGKIAAGKWEFPGGKIEPGETARQALVRELHEELGIDVTRARPLIRVTHDYSDRTVTLDTWRIDAWSGHLHGREAQAFAWVAPRRLHDYPLLAADAPIAAALQLPVDYVFCAPNARADDLLRGLPSLPRGCLLRLRLPGLGAGAYRELATRVIDAARALEIGVILDRDPRWVVELGAAGWHADSTVLATLTQIPPVNGVCLASTHGSAELQRARVLGFHGAVLGPVLATASHPGAKTLGWEKFASHALTASLPLYAIGGVGPADHARVFDCYGQGTAGISAYWV